MPSSHSHRNYRGETQQRHAINSNFGPGRLLSNVKQDPIILFLAFGEPESHCILKDRSASNSVRIVAPRSAKRDGRTLIPAGLRIRSPKL